MIGGSLPIIETKRGKFRTVLLVRRWALKLANDEAGRCANLYEAECYRTTTGQDKQKLCPVLWCDDAGELLVMVRADPISPEEYGRMAGTLMDWQGRDMPWEGKHRDYGRTADGTIVVIDYAVPSHRKHIPD